MIKNSIVYSSSSDYRFKLTKAEGVYLWDDQNRKIMDLTSGWNVANLGWNHPEITEAIIEQAQKNSYAPMWSADPMQEEYAEAVLSAYGGVDAFVRCTGGTDANEVAVKMARAATGRTKVIGFKDTYHGQLFAAMALGYRPEYTTAIQPLVPDFIQLDYPEDSAEGLVAFTATLEAALSGNDIAALFVEPGIVTGWGNCRVAPAGFMEVIRELTKAQGALMVIDEVGTGFSRTGSLFGIHRYSVKPDVVTLAKGITNGGGGMGAVLTTQALVEPTIPKANYTATFGATPLACAAALKTLQIHQRDRVWENAVLRGDQLMNSLQTALPDDVIIRGIGLEMCVDLSVYSKSIDGLTQNIQDQCFTNGLHIIAGDDETLQLMPPCVITESELSEGAEVLIETIKSNISTLNAS